MNWNKKVSGLVVTGVGCFVLGILFFMSHWMKSATDEAKGNLSHLQKIKESALVVTEANRDLLHLKKNDVQNFKASLENEANSKKALFESGVMIHDEKRLLEKQWDIMATSLLIDAEAKKITLLKDDVPSDTFTLSTAPLVYASTPSLKMTSSMRITSKERFAHPERGKAETVDGVLQWIPPQVGTSVRANALGEYVIFTDGGLIIHGPPTKREDHEAYSHLCLNVSLETAKKLYQKTYIGTKVALIQTQSSKAPPVLAD